MTKLFIQFWVGFCLIFLTCQQVLAVATCQPVLWPSTSPIFNQHSEIQTPVIISLKKSSDKLLHIEPHAITTLASAGKTDINDSGLVETRLAFEDADRAAILALAYAVFNKPEYFNKTRDILLNWATVNQPTGNPIDETRLEGLIWAYDLIACSLQPKDKMVIDNWLEKLRNKKLSWEFGPITQFNNHRINQMKMILLLNKVLHHENSVEENLAQMEKYALININSKTGESIDYKERDALYYHNYDLQAWLEISLVSKCCRFPVTRAYSFLSDHIISGDIKGEFQHSKAKIDARRAKGGFIYAKKGGTFDVSKAASTIVTYYTIVPDQPLPILWNIVLQAKPSLWLSFVQYRRDFWRRQDV